MADNGSEMRHRAAREMKKVGRPMVSVRPIAVSDEEAWLKLFGNYIVFYRKNVP